MANVHENLPQRQYHSTKAAYVLPNEYVYSAIPLHLPKKTRMLTLYEQYC